MLVDDEFQVGLKCGHHHQWDRVGTSDPETPILIRARDVAEVLVTETGLGARVGSGDPRIMTTNHCWINAADAPEPLPVSRRTTY